MMFTHRNLYAELHLQPTASASEVRSAYRRAALLAHPDKGGSTAAFRSIAFAFEVLSCPASRALYDQARKNVVESKHRRVARYLDMSTKAPRGTAPHRYAARRKRKRESDPPSSEVKQSRSDGASEESSAPGFSECLSQPSDNDGTSRDGDADPVGHPKQMHLNVQSSVGSSLERLRYILQELSADLRRSAITRMPACVRSELLNHMNCQPSCMHNTVPGTAKCKRLARSSSWSRGTDVRSLIHIHKTSYQAQLRIRHLRMYTCAQADFDIAVSHQMTLVRARQAIDAAGESIWNNPHDFCEIFSQALRSAGTSQEELGLSVFVFMRADEWVGRCATITSPVMSLGDALVVHTKLLIARQTSWKQLRTEWVHLMLQTQHARLQQLTVDRAVAIANKARMSCLQRQLKSAVASAERAIHIRHKIRQKVARAEAQMRRKEDMIKKIEVERLVQKRHEWWAARRKWYRRVDPTLEELLRGPPQYA